MTKSRKLEIFFDTAFRTGARTGIIINFISKPQYFVWNFYWIASCGEYSLRQINEK
jgi:hypothetical protein